MFPPHPNPLPPGERGKYGRMVIYHYTEEREKDGFPFSWE